jgi:hypothetical protein
VRVYVRVYVCLLHFGHSFINTEEFDDILRDTPRDVRRMRRPGTKSMNDMALNRQYAVIIGEPWCNLQAERKESAYMGAEDQAMRAFVVSEAKRDAAALLALERNERRQRKDQEKEEKARLKQEEQRAKVEAKKPLGTAVTKPKAKAIKRCCMPTCSQTDEQGALAKCGAKGCRFLFCADCTEAHKQHTAKFHT